MKQVHVCTLCVSLFAIIHDPLFKEQHQSVAERYTLQYYTRTTCALSPLPPMQEQERRARAESAAGAAMNGPRVEAFKYAGPDFEVRGHVLHMAVVVTTGMHLPRLLNLI